MNDFTPESIMKALVTFFPVANAALEHGVFKAKEFFDTQTYEEDRIIDRYFAPHIVRFHALRHLKRAGQNAYDDIDDNDINLISIPFNGIHINYGRYQIKILKSNHGDLPVPGYSIKRRAFYDQPFLTNFISDNENDTSLIKLLLLWNVKNNYENLGVLSLACPKSGKETRESVEHHFHCKIPSKLLYGEYKIADEITPDEIFDLPLKEIALDETGTEER